MIKLAIALLLAGSVPAAAQSSQYVPWYDGQPTPYYGSAQMPTVTVRPNPLPYLPAPPPIVPPTVHCTSYQVGNTVQTTCN